MSTANELLNKRHRVQRAALTRAINSKDPEKILVTVARAFEVFDTYPGGWPDDWSRWQRAADDAEFARAHNLPLR